MRLTKQEAFICHLYQIGTFRFFIFPSNKVDPRIKYYMHSVFEFAKKHGHEEIDNGTRTHYTDFINIRTQLSDEELIKYQTKPINLTGLEKPLNFVEPVATTKCSIQLTESGNNRALQLLQRISEENHNKTAIILATAALISSLIAPAVTYWVATDSKTKKIESQATKIEALEKQVKNLNSSIIELKNKNFVLERENNLKPQQDLNNRLLYQMNENRSLRAEIEALKTANDDLKLKNFIVEHTTNFQGLEKAFEN